ncbi:MAG: fibronectin type III domain-containing protein [Polyangiaceae bacterium]|nr:fibronectin type III domain-containing protein [Polyangiaceae bacterium]
MRPVHTNLTKLTFTSAAAFITVACGMDMSNNMMPNAPSELSAMELGGGAHLTWKDNSDNESQFMLERKAGAAEFAVVSTLPFNTVQYHDAPLTAGVTYAYRVMAMGKEAAEHNNYSNVVTFALAAASGTGGAGTGGAGAGGSH